MSAPVLYYTPLGAPSRAVLVTAKALGLQLDLKEVNLWKKEQFNPEFLKMNPQHTVPVLVDTDGTTIWDSHAIVTYLVEKYAKDDSLYPKDLAKRALVNQRLHFDSSVIFPLMGRAGRPLIMQGRKTVDQESIDAVEEGYGILEKFFEGREWVAGNSVTVADFSLLTTVTTIDVLVLVSPEKFPKIKDWIKRAEQLPAFTANAAGLQIARDIFKKAIT